MAFLSSGPAPRPAATIIGVPFDATSTFRTGSRDGPAAIRWASQSIETYSPVMQRLLDVVAPLHVLQAGVRAGTREEFAVATRLRYSAPRLDIPGAVWSWLEPRPVYVTIDIDALDPAEAPGTGNPEPDGVRGQELLAFVRRLGLLRVVGLDLVEVSPRYDPSGRTAVLAATIIREAILAITGRGAS